MNLYLLNKKKQYIYKKNHHFYGLSTERKNHLFPKTTLKKCTTSIYILLAQMK